jgi:hypothetical protein
MENLQKHDGSLHRALLAKSIMLDNKNNIPYKKYFTLYIITTIRIRNLKIKSNQFELYPIENTSQPIRVLLRVRSKVIF